MRTRVLLGALALAGCELSEVTVAEPEDIVVVELILRAGRPEQLALVHRSTGLGPPPAVSVSVSAETGPPFEFGEVPALECLTGEDPPEEEDVRCYAARPFFPEAGRSYTVRAETADGRVLTGTTRVPDAFAVRVPAARACTLPPGETLELSWTQSAEAWVYVSETTIEGLGPAFEAAGIALPEDPLRLIGLSISREDTTITFPSEFGLFDRFDDELSEALVALQEGLPAGASAFVVVGAADRNYVNWVRGGNFNPSGQVRVPSVFGDGGTGVFGSVFERERRMTTLEEEMLPACAG